MNYNAGFVDEIAVLKHRMENVIITDIDSFNDALDIIKDYDVLLKTIKEFHFMIFDSEIVFQNENDIRETLYALLYNKVKNMCINE